MDYLPKNARIVRDPFTGASFLEFGDTPPAKPTAENPAIREALASRNDAIERARLILELIDAKRALYGAPRMDADLERAVVAQQIAALDPERRTRTWAEILGLGGAL